MSLFSRNGGAGMPTSFQRFAAVVAAAVFLLLPATGRSQQTSGTQTAYQIQPGRNEISLYERFSTLLAHSANIKTVMDFDAEVVRIEPVQQNPQQVRVSALKTGVTTVSIIDEFGQQFSVEILVRGDVRHLESFIRRLYPNDTIEIEEIKGAVRLDGWVTKPEHVSEIQAVAEQFYPLVMNHMKIGGVQQVMLKCTVMEVQRSKFRRLGMNFSMIRPDNFLISTPGPITPITSLASTGSGTTATLSGFGNSTISYGFTRPNSVFNGFIQAMREEGLLKLHATPTLVTHNGRPASLLNGGETPIITPAGLGTVGVEFKEFGVQLDVVPYILGNGRVRLEIDAAVRDRDFSNAVAVNGVTVPAFIVRRAQTQVEMNFGEALMIAGLVSQRQDGAAAKVPFFGELPWIGAAFGRKQYSEAETELMILVTPEYVAPTPAGHVPPGGPGSFTDIPTDRELFFHHMLEVPKFGDECEDCRNGLGGQQCPPVPFGVPGSSGTNCVIGSEESRSALIRPADPAAKDKPRTFPAGFTESQSDKSVSDTEPPPRKKNSPESSSGLISPSLR